MLPKMLIPAKELAAKPHHTDKTELHQLTKGNKWSGLKTSQIKAGRENKTGVCWRI
jgi:hypothetical protein